MLRPDGEQSLKDFSLTAYPRQVTEIIPDVVYHVMGYAIAMPALSSVKLRSY